MVVEYAVCVDLGELGQETYVFLGAVEAGRRECHYVFPSPLDSFWECGSFVLAIRSEERETGGTRVKLYTCSFLRATIWRSWGVRQVKRFLFSISRSLKRQVYSAARNSSAPRCLERGRAFNTRRAKSASYKDSNLEHSRSHGSIKALQAAATCVQMSFEYTHVAAEAVASSATPVAGGGADLDWAVYPSIDKRGLQVLIRDLLPRFSLRALGPHTAFSTPFVVKHRAF